MVTKEDRDLTVRGEPRDQRVLKDRSESRARTVKTVRWDRLAAKAHVDRMENAEVMVSQDPRATKARLDPPAQRVKGVSPALRVRLEKRAQSVRLVNKDRVDHRASVEKWVSLVIPVAKDPLASKDPEEHLDQTVSLGPRDLLAQKVDRDHAVRVESRENKDLLEILANSDRPAQTDHKGRLVSLATKVDWAILVMQGRKDERDREGDLVQTASLATLEKSAGLEIQDAQDLLARLDLAASKAMEEILDQRVLRVPLGLEATVVLRANREKKESLVSRDPPVAVAQMDRLDREEPKEKLVA